jgi:hypothetical protein
LSNQRNFFGGGGRGGGFVLNHEYLQSLFRNYYYILLFRNDLYADESQPGAGLLEPEPAAATAARGAGPATRGGGTVNRTSKVHKQPEKAKGKKGERRRNTFSIYWYRVIKQKF